MESKIEYAVFDTALNELQVATGEDRERAFRLADRWNRARPGVAIVMERTVTRTEWRPTNTGVVPPFLNDGEEE